jgi:hypothetical protein
MTSPPEIIIIARKNRFGLQKIALARNTGFGPV